MATHGIRIRWTDTNNTPGNAFAGPDMVHDPAHHTVTFQEVNHAGAPVGGRKTVVYVMFEDQGGVEFPLPNPFGS
jgi:hypothetical protein